MTTNRRKTTRQLGFDPADSITHGTVTVAVTLNDPDEPDRRTLLTLTPQEATYLANRLLFHVAALEETG